MFIFFCFNKPKPIQWENNNNNNNNNNNKIKKKTSQSFELLVYVRARAAERGLSQSKKQENELLNNSDGEVQRKTTWPYSHWSIHGSTIRTYQLMIKPHSMRNIWK